MAKPVVKTTRGRSKKQKVQWGKQDNSFLLIKEKLSSLPNSGIWIWRQVFIETDASDIELGAVLCQKESKEFPNKSLVAYISRTLRKAKKFL